MEAGKGEWYTFCGRLRTVGNAAASAVPFNAIHVALRGSPNDGESLHLTHSPAKIVPISFSFGVSAARNPDGLHGPTEITENRNAGRNSLGSSCPLPPRPSLRVSVPPYGKTGSERRRSPFLLKQPNYNSDNCFGRRTVIAEPLSTHGVRGGSMPKRDSSKGPLPL